MGNHKTLSAASPIKKDWQSFVVAYGSRASVRWLEAILGMPERSICNFRNKQALKKPRKKHSFEELFVLWHGRAPTDTEWPKPRYFNGYEWLDVELKLLATLVGSMSVDEIAETLTERLKNVTGDQDAFRSRQQVMLHMHGMNLLCRDFLGGMTVKEAGKQAGSTTIVYQAIAAGKLKTEKVGNMVKIPYDEFERWKETRDLPPEDHVPLASIREPLGIKSDKLSEYARAGGIPGAMRCNPFGTLGAKNRNTQYGTWHIPKALAEKILADHRAGLPMPWHGKQIGGLNNLKITWNNWQRKKHPDKCKDCKRIWGRKGAPNTFEDYCKRYPALDSSLKRHLTANWAPGIPLPTAAREAKRSEVYMREAIANKRLKATTIKNRHFIDKEELQRFISTDRMLEDWIALQTAEKWYYWSVPELEQMIATGILKSIKGTSLTNKGQRCVMQQQVATLRQKLGLTEAEAARVCGVSVERIREIVNSIHWRKSKRGLVCSPSVIVNTRYLIKNGHNTNRFVEDAVAELGVSVDWFNEQIRDGHAKVVRFKLDTDRRVISDGQFAKLKKLLDAPQTQKKKRQTLGWIQIGVAAIEAGVSVTSLQKAIDIGEIPYETESRFRWLQRTDVRAWARKFWQMRRRSKRDIPPQWLVDELAAVGQPFIPARTKGVRHDAHR